MQIFVKKADLATQAADVWVVGTFADDLIMPRDTYGNDCTVLWLPGPALVAGPPEMTGRQKLAPDWRTRYAGAVIRGEANRRIRECFADYMQNNANADLNRSILTYGADKALWPPDAKARADEADRGFAYIKAVRQKSDALETALPADPTADSVWPAKIAPVYI